ncbi:MAG TPA: TIR domain-containing protein, partial [Bryobacteraceae bacterium]|nr:TIR domain-containing protein [Bryobacteraceae bacterium]
MGDRVFFCYAREDQGFAVPLAQELKEQGVGVWLDQWDIPAAAWSADGQKLATASWDNSIAVVDARNGHPLAKLQGHTSYVNTVAWSPDGKWNASGSLQS